jgi:hypothetical protein
MVIVKSRLQYVCDPERQPSLDEMMSKEWDWREYTIQAPWRQFPDTMPEQHGWPVLTTHFVDDDDLARDVIWQAILTGVLIFVNRALIIWFLNWQAAVESSTFGSKPIAMQQMIDLIEALHYMLRISTGVPIEWVSYEGYSKSCDKQWVGSGK